MSNVLLVAFSPSDVLSAAGLASTLGGGFDVVAFLGDVPNAGQGSSTAVNLDAVPPADALAAGLVSYCAGYTHIVAVSSMQSKDALGRLAGLLDAPMVSDVIGVDSPSQFRHPIVAGSLIETVQVDGSPIVLTFRGSAFPKSEASGVAATQAAAWSGAGTTTRVSSSARGGGRPDLTQAKIIVSGGRPLKDAATFESVIGGFADAVHGAAGATRAAVDSGIAPNELQVGQTGKIVAPDLYIAAGISGSTQHMAGIKDSKIIVAINTDADAPIFEIADFGLVADLFGALPELRDKLKSNP